MKQQKATLAEMAEAIEMAALNEQASLSLHYERKPTAPPDTKGERKVHVLESAASLLAIFATYPDETRAFVVSLITKHRSDGQEQKAA